MKHLILALAILMHLSVFGQTYIVPKKSETIYVISDSNALKRFSDILFDNGFLTNQQNGILSTDYLIKFGPQKIGLTATLRQTDTIYTLVIKPRLDATALVAAYQMAFAGMATPSQTIVNVSAGFSKDHNKAFAYVLWLAGQVGGQVKTDEWPNAKKIEITAQKY